MQVQVAEAWQTWPLSEQLRVSCFPDKSSADQQRQNERLIDNQLHSSNSDIGVNHKIWFRVSKAPDR
jgi:hypothetical protein